jgi:hypothetical protein
VRLKMWVTGLSDAGKTTICKFRPRRIPGRRIPGYPRESPLSARSARPRVLKQPFEIGYQPLRAADGRPLDRVQNGLLQNSPDWQIVVG